MKLFSVALLIGVVTLIGLSDNMLDLLKTVVLSLTPVLLMWAKMTLTERQKEKVRLEEKREADELAAAQRKADQAKQVEVASAVKQVASKAQEVATKLDATSTKTEQKLDEIQKVGVASHILVNRNMGIKLHDLVMALAEVFGRSGLPVDKEKLAAAIKDYELHSEQQSVVDTLAGKDTDTREVKDAKDVSAAKNVMDAKDEARPI